MEPPWQRGEDGGRSGISDQKRPSEVGCVGLRGFRAGLRALTGKFGCSSSNSPPPSRVSQVQTPELAAQVAGSGNDSPAEQQICFLGLRVSLGPKDAGPRQAVVAGVDDPLSPPRATRGRGGGGRWGGCWRPARPARWAGGITQAWAGGGRVLSPEPGVGGQSAPDSGRGLGRPPRFICAPDAWMPRAASRRSARPQVSGCRRAGGVRRRGRAECRVRGASETRGWVSWFGGGEQAGRGTWGGREDWQNRAGREGASPAGAGG